MTRVAPVTTESELRRWCWDLDLLASAQDEDTLLMAEPWMVPLLEEAAAGCPKRAYAISIVAHGIRDHALVSVGGVLRIPPVIEQARAAGAGDLVAYLERLARYARPGVVDEAEARSRVHDLTRCYPPEVATVTRAGHTWRGEVGRATPKTLVIDARNGRMWLE